MAQACVGIVAIVLTFRVSITIRVQLSAGLSVRHNPVAVVVNSIADLGIAQEARRVVVVAVALALPLAVAVVVDLLGRGNPVAVVVESVAEFRRARKHRGIRVVAVRQRAVGREAGRFACVEMAVPVDVEAVVDAPGAVVVDSVADFHRGRIHGGIVVVAVRGIGEAVVVEILVCTDAHREVRPQLREHERGACAQRTGRRDGRLQVGPGLEFRPAQGLGNAAADGKPREGFVAQGLVGAVEQRELARARLGARSAAAVPEEVRDGSSHRDAGRLPAGTHGRDLREAARVPAAVPDHAPLLERVVPLVRVEPDAGRGAVRDFEGEVGDAEACRRAQVHVEDDAVAVGTEGLEVRGVVAEGVGGGPDWGALAHERSEDGDAWKAAAACAAELAVLGIRAAWMEHRSSSPGSPVLAEIPM
jgi:hypothetical protein